MNAEVTTGRWNEIRGEIQRRWGRLTDSDLDTTQGQLNRLIGLVQEKYGFSAGKAQREVTQFLNQYGMSMDQMTGQGQAALSGLRRTINRNPWAFVLVALLLGLAVVGFVFKPFGRR